MSDTVPAEQASPRMERPLPTRVQEVLGELVGAAQEGLMALSVGVGLGVLAELMEEEVTEVVRPPGAATTRSGGPCATATRPVRSPSAAGAWASSARGRGPPTAPGEVELSVYRHFATAIRWRAPSPTTGYASRCTPGASGVVRYSPGRAPHPNPLSPPRPEGPEKLITTVAGVHVESCAGGGRFARDVETANIVAGGHSRRRSDDPVIKSAAVARASGR